MDSNGIRVNMTPSHPGEFIRTEVIEEYGLTVGKAAQRLGVRRATLSNLLNGKSGLSPDMAMRIEKAFKISMDMLLRMQAWYDIARLRGHPTDSTATDPFRNLQQEPPQLAARQQDVVKALRSRETEKYPLSQWYLGALYAIDNRHNPDRISQAAHSLRELMEKLPRVIPEPPMQVTGYDTQANQRSLRTQLEEELERYSGLWDGKVIDPKFDKTLQSLLTHFQRTSRPTRKEQVYRAIAGFDPLAYQFDTGIQQAKRDRVYELWQGMEGYAHHQRTPAEEVFRECLQGLEIVILDLLAPISKQDQIEIQTILDLPNRSEDDIERLLTIVKRRGTNYGFFFAQAYDEAWLPILKNRGYFSHPPNAELNEDGSRWLPNWWPIHYLSRVANSSPDMVVEIVLGWPRVDNPRVYDGILEIALQLPGEQSGRLKPKVLEFAQMERQLQADRYSDLLAHWVTTDQTSAALELAGHLVRFTPDPDAETKRARRKENPRDWQTLLKPSPPLEVWDYRRILEDGVRPLADREPYQAASLLIDAVAEMIALKTHVQQLEPTTAEDASEIWCRRLSGPGSHHVRSEEAVVAALTYACEHVFDRDPDAVSDLEKALQGQPWKLFRRLRCHLYAAYPSELTRPWIQELILRHGEYAQSVHHYEFQRMLRCACEHFGAELLAEAQWKTIFDSILSGPSIAPYQARMGEQFTEELFEHYQREFHRRQFRPFASVLFGEYEAYFMELKTQSNSGLSDEAYSPMAEVKSGRITFTSPQTHEELREYTDEELLTYINEWDSEYNDWGDSFVEVRIEALVEAFQSVFREVVLSDDARFHFWYENRDRIERPIYVTAITREMQDYIKSGNDSRLHESLEFCGWVLSHPDEEPEDNREPGGKSRQTPNWNTSRRAVAELVGSCLSEDISLSVSAEGQLPRLLGKLCTHSDWRLDSVDWASIDSQDLYAEAINNTRSLALRELVRFGLLMRTRNPQMDVSIVTSILESRFSSTAEYPLTLPERAILGVNYIHVLLLDEAWSKEHRTDFFPQHSFSQWLAAFGSLLSYSACYRQTFEILRDEFSFATEHLRLLDQSERQEENLAVLLGEHLFVYYLWGLHPLKGDESLLESFYAKAAGRPELVARLFDRVGVLLWNTREPLEHSLNERLSSFLEWRLASVDAAELEGFDYWLKAECLEPEWRLDAYSRLLDLAQPSGWRIYGQVQALHGLLPGYPATVVECFAKLTDKLKLDDIHHIPNKVAVDILRAGLEDVDEEAHENASRSHENLLKRGRSDLLHMGVEELR